MGYKFFMAFQASTPRYGVRGERQIPPTPALKGTFGFTEGGTSIDPSF